MIFYVKILNEFDNSCYYSTMYHLFNVIFVDSYFEFVQRVLNTYKHTYIYVHTHIHLYLSIRIHTLTCTRL